MGFGDVQAILESIGAWSEAFGRYYSDWDIYERSDGPGLVPQVWWRLFNGTNVPYQTVDINTATWEVVMEGAINDGNKIGETNQIDVF